MIDDDDERFESDLEKAVGDKVRESHERGVELWCSLANIEWKHKDGYRGDYSFRSAGRLVAEIRQDGSDYLTWYCSGASAQVAGWLEEAMAELGWDWESLEK